jgi:hypothetical protein
VPSCLATKNSDYLHQVLSRKAENGTAGHKVWKGEGFSLALALHLHLFSPEGEWVGKGCLESWEKGPTLYDILAGLGNI